MVVLNKKLLIIVLGLHTEYANKRATLAVALEFIRLSVRVTMVELITVDARRSRSVTPSGGKVLGDVAMVDGES